MLGCGGSRFHFSLNVGGFPGFTPLNYNIKTAISLKNQPPTKFQGIKGNYLRFFETGTTVAFAQSALLANPLTKIRRDGYW